MLEINEGRYEKLVSWSLTSLFSTNMAISETSRYEKDVRSGNVLAQKTFRSLWITETQE